MSTIQANIVAALLFIMSLPCHPATPIEAEAEGLKAKGDACYNAGRYPEALEYYTQGLNRAKKENNEYVYYACIGNIGNIYASMDDYRRALHYYLKGYKASAENGNSDMQWRSATNIVAVYCMMKDVDNARAFFKQQMNIQMNDLTMKKYYFYSNQALIADAAGDKHMAEFYHKATLDYAREKRMPIQYAISPCLKLGDMKLDCGDAAGAIAYYQQCLDSLNGHNEKHQLIQVYKNMAKAMTQLGNLDEAGLYRHKYLALSDSLFNIAQFNIAAGKLFEYENEENKKRVDSLVSLNRIQLTVTIMFFILAATLAILYITLRHKNKMLLDARQTLMRKNEELITSDRNSKKLLEQYVKALNEMKNTADGTKQEDSHSEQNEIGLNAEQRGRLLNSITSVLEDVEAITRQDFSLKMLADMAKTNTKYVSWIINDTYGKNFKTLLNEYRIREACRRLADHEHYGNVTIQTIYESLGYSSAAAFINAFKNVNGMTPSAYLKLVAHRQ